MPSPRVIVSSVTRFIPTSSSLMILLLFLLYLPASRSDVDPPLPPPPPPPNREFVSVIHDSELILKCPNADGAPLFWFHKARGSRPQEQIFDLVDADDHDAFVSASVFDDDDDDDALRRSRRETTTVTTEASVGGDGGGGGKSSEGEKVGAETIRGLVELTTELTIDHNENIKSSHTSKVFRGQY